MSDPTIRVTVPDPENESIQDIDVHGTHFDIDRCGVLTIYAGDGASAVFAQREWLRAVTITEEKS